MRVRVRRAMGKQHRPPGACLNHPTKTVRAMVMQTTVDRPFAGTDRQDTSSQPSPPCSRQPAHQQWDAVRGPPADAKSALGQLSKLVHIFAAGAPQQLEQVGVLLAQDLCRGAVCQGRCTGQSLLCVVGAGAGASCGQEGGGAERWRVTPVQQHMCYPLGHGRRDERNMRPVNLHAAVILRSAPLLSSSIHLQHPRAGGQHVLPGQRVQVEAQSVVPRLERTARVGVQCDGDMSTSAVCKQARSSGGRRT